MRRCAVSRNEQALLAAMLGAVSPIPHKISQRQLISCIANANSSKLVAPAAIQAQAQVRFATTGAAAPPVMDIDNFKNLSAGNSIDQFEWRNDTYTSPYDVECPLDCIVIYNPSSHACNVAVEDLLRIWPKLRIIQTVVEGRTPVIGAAHQIFIPKNTWGDMAVFKQCYEQYCVKNRFMHDMKNGVYPVWSSMAEDSAVANAFIDMGLLWVGASPKSMDGLGKIEYKQFCRKNDLPTASFFSLSATEDLGGKNEEEIAEKHVAFMTDKYFELTAGTDLEGRNCFIKSEYGGGGRGTKKAVPNREAIETALRGVVNETKKVDGIYVELALDLTGASLYQIEMEVDAGSIVDGGRLVYFNRRNQKMIELGFSSSEILKFLPKEVFAGCVHSTQIIARESKYNGRGTNEILIAKMPNGEWKYFCSEFNKRVQVEHKALGYLKRYKNGELFNTIADQVMRSCGYRPPDYQNDLIPCGGHAVAHVRFIAPVISADGEIMFPVGVEVDESIVPRGYNALIHTGKLHADTDAQFGAALIIGKDWEGLLRQLRTFARDTVVLGKNISRDYFQFLQKFFSHPKVIDLSLGCNETFDVLALPPLPESRTAEVVRYLNAGVSKVLVNGYRCDTGVKDRSHPTDSQMQDYIDLRNRLLMMPVKKDAPFLRFLDHLDENVFFNEMRDTLRKQKGGMVSVFPRDVQQECAGSESHIISGAVRMLTERFAFNSGFIGYEIGGAQYQTAEMNTINSFKLMADALLGNMPTYSLTRSHWMNALEKLNSEQVKFIVKVTKDHILERFSLPKDSKVVPYFPYNFHAGNVEEQDEVTGIMLDAGLIPVPNFVWDPRFTLDHFDGWVTRQLNLWKSKGRILHSLRIKNAGQQKEWQPENIMKFVQAARVLYKKAYGADKDPIIHIHSHNFNGLSPHVAYGLLKLCQADGFYHLIVDTAPPLMTHSSNLVVAKALTLDQEQWDNLHLYNESAHIIWRLTQRFHDFLQVRIDPDTIWAGGTGSSDLSAADKLGIPRHEIEDAKKLGARISGLGGIVTPYSQWSMVVGYTCYKSNLKTYDAVKEHIEAGKTLNLPGNILRGLDDWKTLLEKPALVTKLIDNHKKADPSTFVVADVSETFDRAAIERKILDEIPSSPITEQSIARVLAYGDIGMKALKAEAKGTDNNWLTRYPEIAYTKKLAPGKTFAVRGYPVVFEGIEDKLDSPEAVVTYKFDGRFVRVHTVDLQKAQLMKANLAEAEVVMANPSNNSHIGAFMPGICEKVNVQVGDTVAEGDVLYSINSMKMVTVFKATVAHAGKKVVKIHTKAGIELAFRGTGEAPLVIELSE